MPPQSPTLPESLQLAVALRYLLPALLFLFVLHALRLMMRDLRQAAITPAEPTGPAELVVVQGVFPAAGERFRLASESLVLGRDAECDIVVQDRYASGKHACLSRQGNRFYLSDLGATNGTLLNGQAVAESVYLTSGDEVEIGEVVFRFEQGGER